MSNADGDTGTSSTSARRTASRSASPCSARGAVDDEPLRARRPSAPSCRASAAKPRDRRKQRRPAREPSASTSAADRRRCSATRWRLPASQPATLVASVVLPLPPFGIGDQDRLHGFPQVRSAPRSTAPSRRRHSDGSIAYSAVSASAPSRRERAPLQPCSGSGRSALSLNGISSVSERPPNVWPDPLRRDRQVDLGLLVRRIAVHRLEIRVGRLAAPSQKPCSSAAMRGEYVGSRSLPSVKTYGRPSSPCTSRNASTPVACIAART